MKTRRAPGGRMGLVARWAAAAAVAAGMWVGGAREAEAQDTSSKMPVYYNGSSSSGGAWWWGDATQPWWYSNWSGTQQRPDMKDGWSGDAGADGNHGANIVHFDNNKDPTQTLNGGAWYYIYDIIFETSATARTFNKGDDGVGIKLYHGITNNVSSLQTFNVPISVDGASTLFANSGNMTFTDPVYLNKNLTLRAGSSRTITISGVIANDGGTLSKSAHAGTVVLSGANTFGGNVSVGGSGILRISNGSALGNTTGNTTISSGGTLELTGGITVSENITYAGVGYSSQGGVLSSSGNNTLSGLVANQTTAGSLLVSSGSSLNLSGTFSNTVSTTVGGAGNITIANWQPKVDALEMYKTGSGTLTLTTITKKAPRQGLVLNGGTLALTSAGTVTNLALTNSTAGTTIDLSGAVKVGVVNIKASTTIKVDVGTTGQSVCESLTTMNDGGWAISSDFNLKLTPGTSFDSDSSATWTILTTQGSFNATDLGHVTLDTTAFAGLASSCFTKSISGKSIVVTYRPADVPQTTAVSVTQLTHTYAGSAITLVGTGGNGTGTAVYTFGTTLKTGTTGTGSLTSAGVLTVTAAGTFVFDVTRAASTGYTARTDEVTVTVGPGAQEISGLTTPINKTYGDANFTLGATGVATVGGATVTAAGSVTYVSSDEDVATIDGRTVHIVGAGTCTITASAGSTALYAAAADATATLNVAKKNPTVTASVAPTSIRVGGEATLTGSTDSGATLTFATSSSSIASLSGSGATIRTVTGAGYGTATLTVNSPATANYNAGSATCTITVKLNAPTTQVSISKGTGTPTDGTTHFEVHLDSRGADPGRGTHWLMLVKVGDYPTTPTEGVGNATTKGQGSTEAQAKSLTSSFAVAWPTDSSSLIVYNSTATSAGNYWFKDAVPATHYHVAAYEYNRSGSTVASFVYNTAETSANRFDFWTLATEPSAQASGLTAGTVGSRKASMTWTAGSWTAASGETASLKTLLIVVPSGSSVTAPTDGVAYSAGDTIGAGTVAFAGAGTSADVTGLTPEQTYTVYAYAYAEGGDGTTANYLATSPASRSITTIASQGPNVWATGVTTTNYLLNWSALSGDTAGYDVELDENSAFSSPWRVTPFTNNFTAGEGWERSETSTGSGAWLTVPSGTASGNEEKWYLKGVQRRTGASDTATVGGVTDTGYLYLTTTGDYVDTPVLYGDLSEIVVGWRRGGGDRSLRIDILNPDRSDFKTGVASWSIAGTATAGVISTNIFTNSIHMSGGAGYRIRFYNSSSTAGTIYLHHIRLKVAGSAAGYPGYGMEVGGLTGGSTYYAKVRKNPDGDWSDELGVKAGVLPTGLSATATRNSVTFTWSGANAPAGYAIQVSKTAAPSTWADKSAGTAALTLDSFGTKDWKYIGETATTSSGTLATAPGYASGHIPGVAGNGLESKSFPIAGMTGVRVSFTVEPFNLNQTGGQLSDGRVVVYYQIDDGNWNFLGTAAPVSTSTGANAAFDVPAGALAEGNRVAFRLVAPNAHKYGTSYFISPRLTNVKVSRVSKGSGDFSESSAGVDYKTVDTTQAGTSYTVNVGGSGTSVYFRVQALQGNTANPTAKSVWIEGTGTTTAYTPPSGLTLSGVTRNSMTATWVAGDTYQLDHYVVEWSTSSSFASLAGSANVAAGTLTTGISGLTANTTYYVRVKAVGTDAQSSAYCTAANAKTAVYTAPGTPSGSSITRNSMRVSWTAGNTTDLSKYVLQVSTSSSFPGGSTTSYNVTGGATYQDLSGLTAGTTYYFRVKAVGTDSQESAWSGTGNAATLAFNGPVLTGVTGEGRNKFTVNWTAVAGSSKYVIQWTKCAAGGGEDTLVSTCPDGTTSNRTLLATSPQAGAWSWQRPAGELWPEWDNGYGNFTSGNFGHNLMSSVSYGGALSPKPALVSPVLDLSGYTGGYVSFSLASRHSGYRDPYSQVTLYYSTDGGTSWTKAGTSAAGAASYVWTANQTLEIPTEATGAGKTNVRLKLQADSATTKYSGGNVFTGPMLKLVKVYGTGSTGDYSGSCSSVSEEVDVTGGATTYTIEGLDSSSTYYFRVLSVASSDGVRSSWSEGSGATTEFAGPTGLEITEAGRYTLSAAWDAYGEEGYTTTYNVQLTPCAEAGAESATAATCPAAKLEYGDSTTDWTYQREYSGSTASGYPQYSNGVHRLWGQYSSTTIQPGIISPEMDLSGYVSANVEFSHMYVNKEEWSEVVVSYKLSGGDWVTVATTATATGSTLANANARSIALPAEALVGGVKIRVATLQAKNYNDMTLCAGASIANLKVTARGAGGGDYSGGCSGVQTFNGISSTSKIFSGLAPGQDYYIRVQTVMTKAGVSATSSWTEIPAATAVAQPPPEEVWGENIRQNHMTVAWSEAPGATAGTRYKYEVSGCAGTASTEVAAAETRTDGDLEEGVDDWTYVGGGTAPEATQQSTYGFEMETYPAWARLSENTIVLAGAGEPGIESVEFSTMGASAGTVTFLHGRWYDAGDLSFAAVTLSYSIDGGDSWTLGPVQSASDIETGTASYSRSLALPAGALGHAHVKVRLEARSAADSGAGTTKPIGAAIQKAKVTLTKQVGDYTTGGCVIASGSGLEADQLSVELSGLTANKTYYFRVAASDGTQYGAWIEGQAKTKAVPAAPASAWVVPESIGRHAMTVQWDAVAEAETYVVKVYQGTSASGTLKQTLETSATSLTVTGLDAQRDYYFTIQSKADGESSSGTANTTATTSAALNITGFCVTNILDTSLSVKWDNVANTSYTLEVGPTTTNGATGALYETIECPATTLARSDKGNGWFYLGGNANYPKYYVKSTGTAAQKAEDQGHVLSYSSAGTPGIQSRWFSTFGAKSATIEFLHGRWFNEGANSALQVFYSIDGGTTWTLAGDIAATANAVPGSAASGGAKTVTRFALPDRALGQRTVAIRLLAPNAASGGSYGYGAEIKDLTIKIEAYPEAASTFSDSVSGGIQNLTGLAAGQRYWFRLTATETGAPDSATAIQTAATRKKTTGVVQSQGFEGPSGNGALDTTAWGYAIKYFTVGQSSTKTWADGDPVVEVVDGENPMYGDRALRMSGSASAGVYGVVEFANKDFGAGHSENVAVTIPFAACDLAEGENLWVAYSTDGASSWQSPAGLTTITKGWTMGKIGRGGSDAPNQNWPYNRGSNTTTRPAGDAYTFEVSGVRQIAVRVAFCGNSGSAKHYYYLDEVKLERQATKPYDARATANTSGSVDLKWTPADGQSVVIIRGQDKREAPASVDLDSLPQGYEAVKDGTNFYWVNTASGVAALSKTNLDTAVTGGWKYYYYFYGALANGDGTYTLSKDCLQREVIVRGMVKAIASQGWDGWDEHPWGYRKGRVTNPGSDSDVGYWSRYQSTDPDYWYAHFVEGSFEYDGDPRAEPSGTPTYKSLYAADGTPWENDTEATNQLGVSSMTNFFGTNSFRFAGGSGYQWLGDHIYTNWSNGKANVRTNSNTYINTNNPSIQFDTVDLSGYKNVQFSMHYAGALQAGGNYLHLAISTNWNGKNGTWWAYDNLNDAGWHWGEPPQTNSYRTVTNNGVVYRESRDYALQVQEMSSKQTGARVDFYDKTLAKFGNPLVLNVPDSVTQLTARITFFDSNGRASGYWRNASVFIDEVRLTGEVAIQKPKPYISEIGKNQFMVYWEPVADATTYDVEVTEYCDESKIKLSQAFVVDTCPDGWEKSASGVTFTKTASRLYSGVSGTAHDHGLNLSGASGALTSPEVGGTTNLQFYAKAYNSSGAAKLIVEAKGDKDTAWEEIGQWTAAQLATGADETGWRGFTNSLPNRQWTQVRFRRTGGSGTSDSIYVDDIEFHGMGIYTNTVAFSASGFSETNKLATGLTSGKRYLAHVRAVGSPAGVEVRSEWGETADWTAGDFAVAADGFEMTRSTWASPGSGIAVIAVNDGKAFSEVPAPTGTPAVGSAVGEGVVIERTTSAQSGAGLEHVVPYGSRTDVRDQKYVVYWKRGSYWEGRLETNVTLGIYRSTAADAIAVTNGTADTAIGTYSAAEGKGWSGGWNLWDDANGNIDIVREGSWPYGLVGSNKLAGAGGNMIRFDMSNDVRKVRLHRSLATPADSDVVWMMVTLRSEYGGTNEKEDDNVTMKKMFGVQLTSISDPATAGQGIFASVGNLARRYSDKPVLQIDTSDNSSWPGGTAITWDNNGSGYELKDTGNQGGGTHTIVIKYDMSASPRTLSAAAIYTPNVQTIANNGALSPNSSAPTFNCTATISGTPQLAGIILMGKGYNGKLEFDEVRVGNSWGSLVGKEPVAPFPVSTATATMDGKEMIRLAWTKPAAATDTTVVPNVVRPAAEQVIVLEKNLNTAFTADQLAWKTHSQGESSTIGDAVVRVVYRGSGTEAEHVVLPGTSHRYAFYSYAEGVYAAGAMEVSTDPSSNPLTMDKYGETEYVNPFSYTNSFEVSGSGTHTEWRGGNGFTNTPGNTVHFWATGDGQNGTTANAATWTPVKPADAPAKMGTEIPNYKASAGNVMKVSPSGNTSASLGRTLAQDWGGEAGKTFYIAYRMAYTYDGVNKWAGLKLIDNSGSHRGVFVGKPGTSDSSKQNLLSIDPGGGLGIGFGNYALNGGSGDAYLVVAKVQWTASDKVNVYAMAKYADGVEEFPEDEPTTGWNAQWINMTFAGVHMIELLAGGTGSGVTPGDTYFDEIRFGGSWDDLLGPKVPTDVWMAGLNENAFLGDYVVNYITSKPQGPGQSAKHLLSGADEPSGAAWAAGVDAAWVRNITDRTPPETEWIATNQFKTTGTLYAYGSATGDGETVYSWQHGNSTYRKNTYTVSALPAPTLTAENGQGYKVPLSWTQGTAGSPSRRFEEVMVVRFADKASYDLTEGNLHPEQGKAYYVGDTFAYAGNAARYATVIYRGTATGYTNRPCSNGTTYYYAAYTVNNSYYSERATASATPSGAGGEIEVDGDPTDWVGTPAEPWNSSIYSEGELIWTDKRGEERTDKPNCTSADITEFRVKADSTNVYFLLQLNGGTATMPTNTHIAVGLDTRLSTESTDMNWLADESYTFLGGAYYTNSPAFHYPKIQMGVHWVGGDRNEWQVELYDINSASWHAPLWWKASSKLDGSGNPIASATPCVEWVVPRSELGLAGVTGTAAVTGRFSVATFLNSGSWNNEAVGVVLIASNSCAAVDALAIAPYGANDKDYALGAWDEGLKNNNVDFWMDARFGASALLSDDVPSTPANPTPANDGTGAGNPTLQWSNSTDAEGFVTGWLLEVADTPNFGGDGGHTENGSVLYRVNIEMTPALAEALAADSSRKISYKPMTNCREFWWRVRARDNAGQLSAATVQHYTVTGKQDNDGPVATLKYVGSQVGKFLGDSEYRAEVERNGEAYSIMDSEFGSSSAEFGFVIEWYDINGVYATNHMRAWVDEYDGVDNCEDGHSKWPEGKVVGDYTWNILATNGDGTAYGRVSPNWDLMMVNTNRTSSQTPDPASITVRVAGGGTKTLTWEHHGGTGEPELLIPDAMGEYQPAEGWVIQWGYDDAFQGVGTENKSTLTFSGETLRAYDEGGTETSCNGVQYLTNFVSGVFGLPEYDPEVDLYLTLSAEDCCTSDQWGEQPWDPWPPSLERDHQGSYRGLSCSEYPGQAHENVLTGGWCADGPNPARNVTVNQLIKINVRDNDVVPPIASAERWAASAVDEDGTEFKPSLLVSTNTIAASSANTTWATITGKLPRREGVQRDVLYQLTDAMMAGATRPLSFFFNVYDDYIESGTQRGVAATSPNAGNTRSLTNSAFVVKTWDPTLNEGAGGWAASAENTANFVAAGSYISDMVHDGSGWHEAAGTKGTGPNTVLRWDFSTSDINTLFGMTDILSYIGTHSDGVTNVVQLHAWDSDDNRADDQADAEITFGRLLFSDDDATSPEITGSVVGTGTNYTHFGQLASWNWSLVGSGASTTTNVATNGLKGITVDPVVKGFAATALEDNGGDTETEFKWNADGSVMNLEQNMSGETYRSDKSKYVRFSMGGTNGASWSADMVHFQSRVTYAGPTRFVLTMQSTNGTVAQEVAFNGNSLKATWSLANGTTTADAVGTVKPVVKMYGSSTPPTLESPWVNLTGYDSGVVHFKYARVGSGTRNLILEYDTGSGWESPALWTINLNATDMPDTATAAGAAGWYDAVVAVPMGSERIRFRWSTSASSSSTGADLAALYIVMSAGRDREVPLASMTVEKDLGENGNYTNTVSEVTMSFGGATVGDASGSMYVFRLYGFRATTISGETETPSNLGNWGINNLFLHGIADEPRNQLVTDHDITQGAWTNSLAAMDGSLTGYDTVMSGLWATNSEGTNAPAYVLYYPPTHSSGAKLSSGFYNLRSMSAAKFDKFEDHCTSAAAWNPAAQVDTTSGWLVFPGDDSSQNPVYADLRLTSMAGMTDLTLAGSLKVHAKTATSSGGVNGMDVVLQLLDSSRNVLYTADAQSIEANRQWKTFTLSPVDVARSGLSADPAYARITIRQSTPGGTEVYADDVLLTSAQWGASIENTADNASAWTAAVTNGLPSAQFTVGTASNDLSALTIPLSSEIAGSGDKAYKIVGTVHDFDKDRTDDSLHVSVTNTFLLYDDDTIAPQGGSMFGGPMGIFLGDTVLSTKSRSGSGGEQKWTISDHTLVSMDPSDKINFHMSFYDFSGWETRSLAMANAAKAFTAQMHRNGAAVAPYVQTASEGAAGNPSATNSWQATAKNLYDLATDDDLDAFAEAEGVELAMTAIVHDMDHDRKDDTMGVTQQVGIVWFTDQDIDTPGYGGQTTPYYGVMLSTNVPDGGYASMVNTNEESPNPYVVGGSLAAHQNKPTGADTLATTRAFTLYDGCLTNFDGGKVLVVTANLNDPNTHSGYGRTSTGLRRATSAADPDHPTWAEQVPKWGSEATITVTNSYIAFETTTAGGGGSMVFSNAISDDAFNSSIGQTRMSMQAGHTSWTWDSFSTNLLGTILGPAYGVSGNEFRPLYLNVYAYDNDTDRDDDQLSAQLAGPKVYFRDDDTVAPTATSAEQLFKGGAELAGNPGAATKREQVPWVNNLSGLSVRFTAATDPDGRSGGAAQHEDENGYYDVEQAGIGHYEWALPGSDTPVEGLGSRLTLGADVGGKKSASLSIDMDQGYGDYRLFAVDNDHDRAGDALAGPARPVALGYDITPPPAIGTASGKAFRLDADTESADDPTTQFDLTWPTKVGDGTVNLGPDDTSSDEYGTIPEAFRNGPDSLSPWYSYKIYYTNFEESAIASDDNPNNPDKSWVYNTFIKKAAGSSQPAYKLWQSVVTTNASTDPSAGATPYASLATVSNNAANNQKIRLYDLDFDQHYVVIIVGVDKAGNEGPAGMWSWATNNTIKFAVTQGVVRARADINTLVGVASGTNTVGMAPIPEGGADKAAVLYWMAAGMKDGVGKVNKLYDLIYRDASSFDETGTEQWQLASGGGNSGTSKTNWNYLASGLGQHDLGGKLRFFRASYAGRWQDKKPGTSEKQRPLASEEVYSMNNVVLSEGFNYVSLQGVPWTNTFRGVFGADDTALWPETDEWKVAGQTWPGADSAADITNGATVVEFYSSGTSALVSEWFFYGKDGKWYNEDGNDVTDTVQPDGFFSRPFSITLPSGTYEAGGQEKVRPWWEAHEDTNVVATYGRGTNHPVKAMLWHPIMQVPTNAPAGGFSQKVTRGEGVYNTLSLNLPVSVHPRQLGLVATNSDGTVTSGRMAVNNLPALADQLYVIDSATKEVRGEATMFCDANGEWRYAKGTYPNYPKVTGTPIQPNDILVLISATEGTEWTWTYTPEQFYKLPDRHMGRKPEE